MLHRRLALILFAFALVCPALPVAAQGGPPRTPDELQWSVGVGVISAPRPYKGTDNELFPVPLLELQYKRFYFQGVRMGYRLVDGGALDLDVAARARFGSLDPEDSPYLEGMEERRPSADVGLELAWNRDRLQVSLKGFADALDRSGGLEAELEATWRQRLAGGKLFLAPSIGVVWQDGDLVDYYVGVRPDEVRPDRPQFTGESAFNLTLGLTAGVRLSRSVGAILTVSAERLANEIGDSPVVDRDWGYFALAGITYRFQSRSGPKGPR